MKTIHWVILLAIVIIVGMVILTLLPSSDLLGTRIDRGIGTARDYLPEPE